MTSTVKQELPLLPFKVSAFKKFSRFFFNYFAFAQTMEKFSSNLKAHISSIIRTMARKISMMIT
jgi:hypothetical protein